MATVLVVGATGLLGPYLVEAARDLGKVIASGRTGGANSADLTELAVKGQEFEITVAEKKGTDWAFKALKFTRCVITSANPSNVVIDGAPSASFNCMSLSPGIE